MPIKEFSLVGKKGLVIGVANESSIAWACARLAREMGAEIVASCLNDKARKYTQELTDAAGITLINCDVEKDGELENLVSAAAKEMGQIDFLIHSIAFAPLADLHGLVIDSSSQGFGRAMEISCHSLARAAKLASPHMRDGGSIITMSYLGSQIAVPHYGIMGPVKAALEAEVKYLSQELGKKNIRVHAVSSGPVLTRAASGIEAFDKLMDKAAAKAPLNRLVTINEIANLSLFLCMNASSGMSGQTIYVDAGYHAVD